ncbi:MAG: hypothetical protein JSR77_12145 [Planctomycetes bacterium]|nr:hypothetical protein [Planctomycetota bacterium]
MLIGVGDRFDCPDEKDLCMKCGRSWRAAVEAAAVLWTTCVFAVDPVIDVDADGIPDHGVVTADGIHLRVLSGDDGRILLEIQAPSVGSRFSPPVLVVPDLASDGKPDLVVVSPGTPSGANAAGAVFAFSSADGALVWSAFVDVSMQLSAVTGFVRDQDRDSVPEIIVELAGGPSARSVLLSGRTGEILAVRSGTAAGLVDVDARGIRLYVRTDVNDSGAVDIHDLAAIMEWITSDDARADVNGDGMQDGSDIAEALKDYFSGEMTVQAWGMWGGAGVSSISGAAGSGAGANFVGDAGARCGCPAHVNDASCFPFGDGPLYWLRPTLRLSCPTEYPAEGGCIDVPFEFFVPAGMHFDGIGGLTCVASCNLDGTGNVVFEPPPILTWAGDRSGGSIHMCLPSGARHIRVCMDYSVTTPDGTTHQCVLCSECANDCPSLPTGAPDVDLRCPRWATPGDVVALEVIAPRGGVGGRPLCETIKWELLEGADWVVSPVFESPNEGGIPARVDRRAISVQMAQGVIPPGESRLVRVRATCSTGDDNCPLKLQDECQIVISADSDGDGLADLLEQELAGSQSPACPNWQDADSDDDGFSDGTEWRMGSNPCDPASAPNLTRDSDHDGLTDYEEDLLHRGDRLNFDSDSDGVQDLAEWMIPGLSVWHAYQGNTREGLLPEYLMHDADRDGLLDDFERQRGLDPMNADQDGDGIRDGLEVKYGMDPTCADQGPAAPGLQRDTDGDGLTDEVESKLHSNASMADTDGDGLSDGGESRLGLDPNSATTYASQSGSGVPFGDGASDWDGDGINNASEEALGLDPGRRDTDGDGVCDLEDSRDGSEARECKQAVCLPIEAGCENGACLVFEIKTCIPGGGTLYANGEPLSVADCANGPAPVYIPVTYGQQLVVTVPGDSLGGQHILGAIGIACKNADGSGFHNFQPMPPGGFDSPPAWPQKIYNSNPAVRDPSGQPIDMREIVGVPNRGDGQSGCNGLVTNCAEGPPSVHVWIDSNNDAGFTRQGLNDLDSTAASESPHPGKIILASTWDNDGDNIPDFADGYGAPPWWQGEQAELFDTSSDGARGPLTPMTVFIRGSIDASLATLTFNYFGSDPMAVQQQPSGQFIPDPSGGRIRVWLDPTLRGHDDNGAMYGSAAHGRVGSSPQGSVFQPYRSTDPAGSPQSGPCEQRRVVGNGRGVHEGGLYITPGHPYTLDDLGIGQSGRTVKVFIEAVAASTVLGGETIQVQLMPAVLCTPREVENPQDPDPLSESVKVTALDLVIRPIRNDGTFSDAQHVMPPSFPSPIFNVSAEDLQITNVTFSGDRILADIRLTGNVRDSSCNLVPGLPGSIQSAYATIDGSIPGVGTVLELPLIISKATSPDLSNPTWRVAPWPYQGTLNPSILLTGVEIQEGANRISVSAANRFGNVGSAELWFNINAEPPSDEMVELVIDLNNGEPVGGPQSSAFISVLRRPEPQTQFPLIPLFLNLTGGNAAGVFQGEGGARLALPEEFELQVDRADGFLISLSIPALQISNLVVWVDETGASSRLFSGNIRLPGCLGPTWEGYTFEVGDKWNGRKTLGGATRPFLWQLQGPREVRGWMEGVVIAGEKYNLVNDGDEKGAFLQWWDDQPPNWNDLAQRTAIAVGKSALELVPPSHRQAVKQALEHGQEPIPLNLMADLPYVKGMGQGAFHVVSDMWDGTKKAAVNGAYVLWHYNPIATNVRIVCDGQALLPGDDERLYSLGLGIRSGVESVSAMYDAAVTGTSEHALLVWAVANDQVDVVDQIDVLWRRRAEVAVTLLEGLQGVLEQMPEEQRGRITGEVFAQVAMAVVPAGSVVGAGAVTSKAAAVSVACTRIEQSAAIAALDAVAAQRIRQKAQEIARIAELVTRGENTSNELLSIYKLRRSQSGEQGAWATFRELVQDVRRIRGENRTLQRGHLMAACEQAIKDAYLESGGHGPTVAEIRELLAHRRQGRQVIQEGYLAAMDLETHHVIPIEWLREMIKIRFPEKSPTQVEDLLLQIKDTMPGFPLRKTWHGRGRGERSPDGPARSTIHDMLQRRFAQFRGRQSLDDYVQALNDAYREFNLTYGSEHEFNFNIVFADAERWLRSNNIIQ